MNSEAIKQLRGQLEAITNRSRDQERFRRILAGEETRVNRLVYYCPEHLAVVFDPNCRCSVELGEGKQHRTRCGKPGRMLLLPPLASRHVNMYKPLETRT